MVSKQDFVQWRNDKVTRELESMMKEAIENYASELITREVPMEHRDQLVRGAIKSLVAVLEWEPDFTPDNEEA